MPSGRVTAVVQPDVLKVTRAEAKALIPMLEALKNGDIARVLITDATQTLTLLKGNRDSALNASLTCTIADTTLSQNFTMKLNGHTLIRFLNAMRQWGDSVAEFTLTVENVPGFTPSVRFLLAAGS